MTSKSSQEFGREKKTTNSGLENMRERSSISLPFVVLLCSTLLVFGIYYRVSNFFIEPEKIDIINNDLGDIADYLLFYDEKSSNILSQVDTIIQSSKTTENILEESDIRTLWKNIAENKENFNNISDKKYSSMLNLVSELQEHDEEILDYLGEHNTQHFLIILQNTAEQRPNGGFFGSFAVVSIYGGTIKDIHFLDSYLPQKYFPNMTVTLPKRAHSIYAPETKRIAANKFGFHDLDAKILTDLYNKTFNSSESNKLPTELCESLCNTNLAGVVFVKTSMIETILPNFLQKQRERQFLNASIDIIRGQNLPNKKEKYFQELQQYLEGRIIILIKNTMNKFQTLTSDSYIGIYLTHGSSELHHLLEKHSLTTLSPSESKKKNMLYLRDTNSSFNKADHFLRKDILITDKQNNIILQSQSNQIDLNTLPNGEYRMMISYELDIPNSYKNYISGLERNYEIELTDRELGILAVKATNHYPDFVTRIRATRSQIYYPDSMTIDNISGDHFGILNFDTPFGKGLQYKLETAKNLDNKHISIDFSIKNNE